MYITLFLAVGGMTIMYICKYHGKLGTNYCEQCHCILICDHSVSETVRVGVILDCTDGEKTDEVMIRHCSTCGKILNTYHSY